MPRYPGGTATQSRPLLTKQIGPAPVTCQVLANRTAARVMVVTDSWAEQMHSLEAIWLAAWTTTQEDLIPEATQAVTDKKTFACQKETSKTIFKANAILCRVSRLARKSLRSQTPKRIQAKLSQIRTRSKMTETNCWVKTIIFIKSCLTRALKRKRVHQIIPMKIEPNCKAVG